MEKTEAGIKGLCIREIMTDHGVALTGRNRTGPYCVGRPTTHVPAGGASIV